MAKKKRKTIGKMAQSRGVMPPPTVKDEIKTKKNDRSKMKQRLKNRDYEAV